MVSPEVDSSVFSAMQTGNPLKVYIKTILGKVFITKLDEYSGQPTGVLLEGNPRRNDERSVVKIWTPQQDMFFRSTNKRYFENGTLIEYTIPVEEVKEKAIESYTDDELKEVLNQKWYALEKTLNNTKSEAVLIRLIAIAKEMEKSSKVVNFCVARLSEIQTLKAVPTEEEDYS